MNPWESSQLPFGDEIEYSQLVVEEASRILAMSGSKSELSSILHFGMGVMPPFYFTAIMSMPRVETSCSDSSTTGTVREGLCDREESVAIAERVIEIEAAAVSSPEILIPDASRVCNVTMEQQDTGKDFNAIFSFRSKGDRETMSYTRQSWTRNPSRGKFVLCT